MQLPIKRYSRQHAFVVLVWFGLCCVDVVLFLASVVFGRRVIAVVAVDVFVFVHIVAVVLLSFLLLFFYRVLLFGLG